jgi:hypothetical protein
MHIIITIQKGREEKHLPPRNLRDGHSEYVSKDGLF